MSSRHPKNRPFDVEPSCWLSPRNGRPLTAINFTTLTTLVRTSLQYRTSLSCWDKTWDSTHWLFFLEINFKTLARWSFDCSCCFAIEKECFQSLKPSSEKEVRLFSVRKRRHGAQKTRPMDLEYTSQSLLKTSPLGSSQENKFTEKLQICLQHFYILFQT